MDKAEELMNLPESLKQEAVELLNDVYVKGKEIKSRQARNLANWYKIYNFDPIKLLF